jgi:hypothetical protein
MKALFVALLLSPALLSSAADFHIADHLDPAANAQTKQMAEALVKEGKVRVSFDPIDEKLSVDPVSAAQNKNDYVDLTVTKRKGQKPRLIMGAVPCSSDWIFMHTAAFRFGTNVVRLSAHDPLTDVLSDGRVFETATWIVDTKEIQGVVRAIAGKASVICRFEGRKASLSTDFNTVGALPAVRF